MVMDKKHDTIAELTAIFPQHNEITISYIYDDVIRNVGEENFVLVLPSCIERLLELPDGYNPHNNDIPDGYNPPKNDMPAFAYGVSPERTSNNSSPLSDDEILKDLQTYRNRQLPTYREKSESLPSSENDQSASSSSRSSPVVIKKDYDYFADNVLSDNDDALYSSEEVQILEQKSTKRENTKPLPIENEDDIIILPFPEQSNVSNNLNRKRKFVAQDGMAANNNEMTTKKMKDTNGMTDFNKTLDSINRIKTDLKTVFSNADSLEKELLRVSPSILRGVNSSNKDVRTSQSSSTTKMPTQSRVLDSSLSPKKKLQFGSPMIQSSTITKTVQKPSETLTSRSSAASDVVAKTETDEPVVPDYSLLCKGMFGFNNIALEQIKCVITDVDQTYLKQQIAEQPDGMSLTDIVAGVVTFLLDNQDYPKIIKIKPLSKNIVNNSSSSSSTQTRSHLYYQQAVMVLQNAFPQVSTKVIRTAIPASKPNYKKAYVTIQDALKAIHTNEKKPEETMIGSFMRGRRPTIKLPSELENQLQEDIDTLKMEWEKNEKEKIEKGDRVAAVEMNIKQYEEEGQAIECGCCYGDATFENMVQCTEGHLFCAECLQRYSKEAVFGTSKLELICMTDGCGSSFPLSQMKKALTEKVLQKYFERVQDEDLKLANIDNLIRCPHCDFAAEMPEGDKVFSCQNPSCLRETCRYCQAEWSEHFGLPCKEVEKKEETNLRTTYEEKMTQAKVRKCWQCKAIFLKSSGCNKMTCRCAAKMCYICRQPKIDYGHFCQHLREPGQGCTKCKKCSLWTDPTEDDDRAVAELQKEAEVERKKVNGEDSSNTTSSFNPTVGPKIDVKKKENKTNNDNNGNNIPRLDVHNNLLHNNHVNHHRHQNGHQRRGRRRHNYDFMNLLHAINPPQNRVNIVNPPQNRVNIVNPPQNRVNFVNPLQNRLHVINPPQNIHPPPFQQMHGHFQLPPQPHLNMEPARFNDRHFNDTDSDGDTSDSSSERDSDESEIDSDDHRRQRYDPNDEDALAYYDSSEENDDDDDENDENEEDENESNPETSDDDF